MPATKEKVSRSQSEAIKAIRRKFQEQMKEKGYTYNKHTQEVEKKS